MPYIWYFFGLSVTGTGTFIFPCHLPFHPCSVLVCVSNVDSIAENTKHILNISFIKPIHAHVIYVTIQFFVYSYIFGQNSAIFAESIHQYLKITKI